ncbi:MAG: GNAT family N-acetyltransferase [Maricaulaceae bacterium]|jgi:putative acetyltransferase
MEIRLGDLSDSRVTDLLVSHATRARSETAPGSAHALDLDAFAAPDITLWAAWDGETLLGVGALKRHSAELGEIKSMHTVEAARRRGVGERLLARIVEQARADGVSRLCLETGSWDFFKPARAFYARCGFAPCEPFADYKPDPNSVFMALTI